MKAKRVAQALLFLAVLLAMLVLAVGQGKDEAWACLGKDIGAIAINADASTQAYWGLGKITLSDVATGKALDVFDGPQGGSRRKAAIAFSPDDKTLALAADDASTIHLVDLGLKKVFRELRWFDFREITAIAFSPDGRTLAAVAGNTAVRFWDVVTGEKLRDLTLPSREGKNSIAFSPDGKTLAIASRSATTIHLWDVMTGIELRELKGVDAGSVFAIAFSPDGRMLAAVGGIENFGPALLLFDVATGQELRHPAKAIRNLSTDNYVGFSRNGRRLVAFLKGSYQSWTVTSREESIPFLVEIQKPPSFAVSASESASTTESASAKKPMGC